MTGHGTRCVPGASGAIELCREAAGEIAMATRKWPASFPDNCYREAIDRLAREIAGLDEHGGLFFLHEKGGFFGF